MERLTTPEQAYQFVMQRRMRGETVGLVPTMGALHEGHLSLVKLSRQTCDHTVATIFVNPTQFAPTEDLSKYPRTLQQDCDSLERMGTDAVFLPANETMYPDGFSTMVGVPEVGKTLEGVCRPTHFQGVTTIVLKLFNLLPATHAVFGSKDYQQLRVIEAMVRDLNVPIEIVPGKTVREPDGLAMSSRNRYLSEGDRRRALLLSAALNRASEMTQDGVSSVSDLESEMRRVLLGSAETAGVDKIDYATVVDARTLCPIDQLRSPAIALIAAYVGQTRLIDNRILL
ncbi:pantoate--beta-alanine ligase [Stieleria varia]|uniref:Pantothenate synthetase n=1 Tax=Stieleria varia TaxID=2528005 RepID=A0A5C6AU57_9BACT|nr:pantoate--beta-alanine ligase [Stieleria varia]TWU02739.1 Pantoate-beta-alanine ligase [Stieleria varia]